MKKKLITLILLPLLMLVACERDLTDINVDPKNPQVAPAGAFFSNSMVNLMDALTSTNVNENIFRMVMQYWQGTTYTDESNYDLVTRQIPRQMWNFLYRDVLRDLREAKAYIPDQVRDEAQAQNQMAISEIMEVVTWYYLVTTFGDIPYTEALDVNIIQPVYDNQQDIYYDLLDRLDAAIGQLNPAAAGFGDADLMYGGDVEAWQRFANSFKLKMGMTIADVDDARARAVVESAVAAGVFQSNEDNAEFAYTGTPPNTNPVWEDLVQSNRKDFVAASTIVERMETLSDPRIPVFFSTDAVGGYSGGIPGATSPWAQYSKPGDIFYEPTLPGLLLDYSEVEFFLAEAVERGYAVGGAAKEHYDAAVTASILYWGGTTSDAQTYLGRVPYSSGNWKQVIGEQKWIALYNRGWDAWIEWRRLDAPTIAAPTTAETATPLRFTYPIPEQNVNTANYNAASAALGSLGDDVTQKLFWDVQ